MENPNEEDTVMGSAAAETEVSRGPDQTAEAAVGKEVNLESAGDGEEDVWVETIVQEADFRVTRKRVGPRQQTEEVQQQDQLMAILGSTSTSVRRGRGRPRGGNIWKRLPPSLGGIAGDPTAGKDFTPFTLTVQIGENIVEKMLTFSEVIRKSLCIISASGALSQAEIIVPDSSGDTLCYEGFLTIVYLNGSHLYDEEGNDKTFRLSVQFANTEGQFNGGAVGSKLIAAMPTQILIGTFKQNFKKKRRQRRSVEPKNEPKNEPKKSKKTTTEAAGAAAAAAVRIGEGQEAEPEADPQAGEALHVGEGKEAEPAAADPQVADEGRAGGSSTSRASPQQAPPSSSEEVVIVDE